MRQLIYMLFITGAAGMLVACDKDNGPQTDVDPPGIVILEPLGDSSYEAGQEVDLIVSIMENQELHEYSIVLRSADGQVATTLAIGHLHTADFEYSDTFELPALPDTQYTITVKASDHNNNQATKSVAIFVN